MKVVMRCTVFNGLNPNDKKICLSSLANLTGRLAPAGSRPERGATHSRNVREGNPYKE